jgi:hypothetical protein
MFLAIIGQLWLFYLAKMAALAFVWNAFIISFRTTLNEIA